MMMILQNHKYIDKIIIDELRLSCVDLIILNFVYKCFIYYNKHTLFIFLVAKFNYILWNMTHETRFYSKKITVCEI